jgi:RNHCP domain
MTAPGTRHRNHCPTCLWSLHVDDDVPGDRDADCAGSMEPIGVTVRDDGEWALVHRCAGCSTVHVNRIAGDDNPLVLMRLAVRPLAQPPFPLEWLTRVGRGSPGPPSRRPGRPSHGQVAGWMFWLIWNTFIGSYCAFTRASRS